MDAEKDLPGQSETGSPLYTRFLFQHASRMFWIEILRFVNVAVVLCVLIFKSTSAQSLSA